MTGIDFTYWDEVEHGQFLTYDESNPGRDAVGKLVDEEVKVGAASLLEIGPGEGIDWRTQFRTIDGLAYTGIEGSRGMLEYARAMAAYRCGSDAMFRHGTFGDLTEDMADIVYTRSTLEHQPGFEDPLRSMLRAARRLVLVSWYRTPEYKELKTYDERTRVHYNTYAENDVLLFLGMCAWHLDRVVTTGVEIGNTNTLWVIRPC